MTFNSYYFLFVFLPLVTTGYSVLRGTRWVNIFLALASLFFYAYAGPLYLIPLLFTCLFDFAVGQKIAPENPFKYKKALFVFSLVMQLGLLCVFKYGAWFSHLFTQGAAFAGIAVAAPAFALILPPGISFYTFHTISYTTDIYRGRFKPHNRLIDYITFVAFFPQLVAGPIARASELLPQIAAKRPAVTWAEAEIAIWLIAFGLFKKMVLADNFAMLVNHIGATLETGAPPAGAGLLFAYGFAAQIYCDFSAYTDIARGVAKLFNIELTRNFLTPYFAISASDFWRRWHISLSNWLRDYLYIPLGGDREGRMRTLRNLFITMFLGGLWHGAGIGFILWGLYHGMLLVLYRLLKPEEKFFRLLGAHLGRIVSIILMFHLVCVGWIFFRASSDQLYPAFSSIIALFRGISIQADFLRDMIYGLVLYGSVLAATEFAGYVKHCEFVDLYSRWHWIGRGIAYVAIFYGIIMFAARQQNEFIYFQF